MPHCATGVLLLCDSAVTEVEGSGIVVSVERWTGREAAVLQECMRLSIRQFAQRLGVNAATVTKWRKGGAALKVSNELQQVLDATLGLLTPAERDAFQARCARQDSSDSVRMQKAATAAGFAVVSHQFIPVYLGSSAGSLYNAGEAETPGPSGLNRRVLKVDGEQEAYLHVFDFGVGVVHLAHRLRMDSVTDLAIWRYRSYIEHRKWTETTLKALVATYPGSEPNLISAEYVLSVYELVDHSWTTHEALGTALQLLATPSVLVDRTTPEGPVALAASAESDRFTVAWAHPEAVPFNGGVSRGVASWSGVAYHPEPGEQALTIGDVIAAELDTQALWALSTHLLQLVEEGQDPSMPNGFDWRWIRAAHTRLTTARSTETEQHRALRAAIMTTSELPQRLAAARAALQEAAA